MIYITLLLFIVRHVRLFVFVIRSRNILRYRFSNWFSLLQEIKMLLFKKKRRGGKLYLTMKEYKGEISSLWASTPPLTKVGKATAIADIYEQSLRLFSEFRWPLARMPSYDKKIIDPIDLILWTSVGVPHSTASYS